ncbi:hypothetical protein L873DRAFT_468374 [Choiromyces venosus 120613-1]|uniref:Uncharacterized protein n=1 Tax=Choiromyces venosus 120613-1 TaxID=1336337 RepID=A0A3N4IWQ8_9PEZI|nr:hypothetical protein L873DRAFT_468374 [Choiromyces venosus 120613-1]
MGMLSWASKKLSHPSTALSARLSQATAVQCFSTSLKMRGISYCLMMVTCVLVEALPVCNIGVNELLGFDAVKLDIERKGPQVVDMVLTRSQCPRLVIHIGSWTCIFALGGL